MKAPVKTFELIPPDTYQGVCIGVIDLGTHDGEYKGNPIERHLVLLMWELPEYRIKTEDGDRAFVISKRYTFSMSKKAHLRRDMESWRGEPFSDAQAGDFNFKDILGANALIQVIHNESGDNTYANVNTVSKILKSMKKKEAENSFLFFDFRNGIEYPEGLPDWVAKIINKSKEFERIMDARQDPSSGQIEPNIPKEQSPEEKPEDDETDLPF